ncbi:MAG: hypothetical protein ACK5D5_03000 [Bacteroidota bacterium]|jgi:hypothetical protein
MTINQTKIKYFLSFLIVNLAISVFAQNNFSSPIVNKTKLSITENDSIKKIGTELKIQDSEASLTPEEQGFVKFIINDRVIYRKVVDNVTIEFVPELEPETE